MIERAPQDGQQHRKTARGPFKTAGGVVAKA